MKRYLRILGLGAMLVAPLVLSACGDANDFGQTVDFEITQFVDQGGTDVPAEVGIYEFAPLSIDLNILNYNVFSRARTRRVEVEYTASFGPEIPMYTEALVLTLEQGAEDTATGKVTPSEKEATVKVIDYTQLEYIKKNRGVFPDLPFQLTCRVTLFYDTSGGQTQSVERQVSITVNE